MEVVYQLTMTEGKIAPLGVAGFANGQKMTYVSDGGSSIALTPHYNPPNRQISSSISQVHHPRFGISTTVP